MGAKGRRQGDFTQNFWNKVRIGDNDSCWEWLGCRDRQGYGKHSCNAKTVRAHRYAYGLVTNRPISEGVLICHTCDNPGCVNPCHLFTGTQKDNIQDCVKKGRFQGGKFHRKLTDDQAREIRFLYEEVPRKYTQRELGKMFGVSQFAILHIVHNKRYQNVPQHQEST